MHTENINGSWHLIDHETCIICGQTEAQGIVATVAMPAMKRVICHIHERCIPKSGTVDRVVRLARKRANRALREWDRSQQYASN